jgi:hypothetical protein
MPNIGTWIALAGVAVGFVILLYLLFKEPTRKKK